MRAVICERWGEPDEVLKIKDVPLPEHSSGQVRVRMIASPVNPSDVMMIRGMYGRQPALPATPGFEGVGIVEAGSGFLARRVMGRRVAVLNGVTGNWQEYVVIPSKQAVPVPRGLSDEQAATFFINPATALAMTTYVLRVRRGAWLLQTAAASAVGRMIIRLGQEYGFRTLNVVRRKEQAQEVVRLGGTAAVATDSESLYDRVQSLTNGQGVPCAIDAVGGSTGFEAVRCLARGGRMLVYGTLSGEPIPLDPRQLMVGQKRVEGFWLSEWVKDQGIFTMLLLFRKLGKLIQSGVLATEIGPTFPLDEVCAAVRHAQQPGRNGKVLLRIGKA
jgi:NADPH:quinone reductase-like Zn-dependent oxidoreductase